MPKIVLMNAEGWPGIEHSAKRLQAGASPLDVIEEGIKLTEKDPGVHTVGYGSPPNALGVMQLDASIMNGDTLETAAVGALEGIMHPISVARAMLSKLPHVMLVGEGAQQFALECGFKKEELLSPEAKLNYEKWKEENLKGPIVDVFKPDEGKGSHGTIICIARDDKGRFGGGVSTSGWDYKYPGRLGDSPVIGAGMYVDSRYGGAACTHCGENAIRTSLAHAMVLYMKKGASVQDAVTEGLQDLRALKGGFQGQVVLYAVDKNGEHFVARRFEGGYECEYLFWTEGMKSYEKREAVFWG